MKLLIEKIKKILSEVGNALNEIRILGMVLNHK